MFRISAGGVPVWVWVGGAVVLVGGLWLSGAGSILAKLFKKVGSAGNDFGILGHALDPFGDWARLYEEHRQKSRTEEEMKELKADRDTEKTDLRPPSLRTAYPGTYLVAHRTDRDDLIVYDERGGLFGASAVRFIGMGRVARHLDSLAPQRGRLFTPQFMDMYWSYLREADKGLRGDRPIGAYSWRGSPWHGVALQLPGAKLLEPPKAAHDAGLIWLDAAAIFATGGSALPLSKELF